MLIGWWWIMDRLMCQLNRARRKNTVLVSEVSKYMPCWKTILRSRSSRGTPAYLSINITPRIYHNIKHTIDVSMHNSIIYNHFDFRWFACHMVGWHVCENLWQLRVPSVSNRPRARDNIVRSTSWRADAKEYLFIGRLIDVERLLEQLTCWMDWFWMNAAKPGRLNFFA